jgi:hypothetical protein
MCRMWAFQFPRLLTILGFCSTVQLNTFYPSQIDTQQHVHMHVHVRKYAVCASEGRHFIRLDL